MTRMSLVMGAALSWRKCLGNSGTCANVTAAHHTARAGLLGCDRAFARSKPTAALTAPARRDPAPVPECDRSSATGRSWRRGAVAEPGPIGVRPIGIRTRMAAVTNCPPRSKPTAPVSRSSVPRSGAGSYADAGPGPVAARCRAGPDADAAGAHRRRFSPLGPPWPRTRAMPNADQPRPFGPSPPPW
jgi:hypothetical protein